jgi:hypothetical protein
MRFLAFLGLVWVRVPTTRLDALRALLETK